MIEYEKEYFYHLEQGQGSAFYKQERVLSYIQEKRKDGMKKEFYEVCWLQYVEEIFRLFKLLELEQFEVLDTYLPDKAGIERGIVFKDRKGTQDADN